VVDVTRRSAALDRGTLAGLALDVLPVEPVPAGLALCSRIRVLF
jgi:phosphoglycerate dehydrogenase-like enzyme